MHVFMCMFVRMFKFLCVCTYVCTYVCVYRCTHLCICACEDVLFSKTWCMCPCVHVQVWVNVFTCSVAENSHFIFAAFILARLFWCLLHFLQCVMLCQIHRCTMHNSQEQRADIQIIWYNADISHLKNLS